MFDSLFNKNLLCLLICLIFIIFVILYLILRLTTEKLSIIRFQGEKSFIDPSSIPASKHHFPSLHDPPSIELSVIIPAYNEENRLPVMLDECIDFMEKRCRENDNYTYEIIVVDDGSVDNTTDVALKYSKTLGVDKFRVLTLIKNRGKGGAVRLGMLSARGSYLLFADADGATKFRDIEKLENVMKKAFDASENCIVIGSRAHLEKDSVATRTAFRTFLMYGFHSLVWLFGVRNVRDTQCGFKLFTRKSALPVFLALHVERWAFDVELLYIAHQLKIQIEEVSVNWTEIEGSKIIPFWSWIEMGRDLVLMWLKYQTRIWTIDTQGDKIK